MFLVTPLAPVERDILITVIIIYAFNDQVLASVLKGGIALSSYLEQHATYGLQLWVYTLP